MLAVDHVESVAPGRLLRLAHADPPYPGKARLYRHHADYAGEVDHKALLARMAGWALVHLGEGVARGAGAVAAGGWVAVWHRGQRPTRCRWPLHAWEPVIYCRGCQPVGGARRADSIVYGVGPLELALWD